jgi:arylsulfatase A-like enzyme
VIWIIFDEWSQAITFEHRPAGLELPNFDRLRLEAFYATAAEPPGGFTRVSIPSLLLGEHAEATPSGVADLLVQTAAHRKPVSLSSLPNVFDTAREMGFNTALVGWYHPYGRLLNRSLTKCYWTAEWLPPGVEEWSHREALPTAMWDRARFQFAALPLIHRIPALPPEPAEREAGRERFQYLQDRALEIVADPSIGLAFIHLPIPHPPAIYDRSRNQFTTDRSRGYLDNLALADACLEALRQKLEDAGLWDRTALLVSSDHSVRPSMWRDQHDWNDEDESAARLNDSRVPFLLKLPGQSSGVAYDKTFDTDVSRGLVTAILAGEIEDPGAIAAFLDRH